MQRAFVRILHAFAANKIGTGNAVRGSNRSLPLSRSLAQFFTRYPVGPTGWRNPDGFLSVDDPFRNAWARLALSTPPSGGVLHAAICAALHRISIRSLDELSLTQARCGLGFERRVDAAIDRSALKTRVGPHSTEHGVIATGEHAGLALSCLDRRADNS